jgi:hypothetical protein
MPQLNDFSGIHWGLWDDPLTAPNSATPDGDAYIAGSTLSTNYPTTAGSVQASAPSPGKQGFIANIGAGGSNPPPPPPPPGDDLLFLPFMKR